MKAKIKWYGNEVTNICDKEIPKVDSNHNYLAVINLDSTLKKDENFYSQVCLKKFRNTLRKGK